jgi:hypothetical protein
VIWPEVGADPDVVAAMMIAAIDQHVADAGGAHFAKRSRGRSDSHRKSAPSPLLVRLWIPQCCMNRIELGRQIPLRDLGWFADYLVALYAGDSNLRPRQSLKHHLAAWSDIE